MPFAPSAMPSVTSQGAAPALSTARLERTGHGNWMACFGVGADGYTQCAFQGTVRNTGTGCATAIRGVVHFYDSNKTELSTAAWTADAPLTRPNDTVTYRTADVPIAVVNATAGYEVAGLQWTDVACN